MLEAKVPSSFAGWEAIVVHDPEIKGVVLSDEHSKHLQASVLTVDWNTEPPEAILVDHGELLEIDNGYLLIRTAGRTVGLVPQPIIHQCDKHCPSFEQV